MKELKIDTSVEVFGYEELSAQDALLVQEAQNATRNSYAPYSGFQVGAAACLEDGTIVTGSNQENAAYPSGLCAERTTLFYANSQYPSLAVKTLAVAAYTSGNFVKEPVAPCGACRQVILETETRYSTDIRILLCGQNEVYVSRNIKNLLPLCFLKDHLEG